MESPKLNVDSLEPSECDAVPQEGGQIRKWVRRAAFALIVGDLTLIAKDLTDLKISFGFGGQQVEKFMGEDQSKWDCYTLGSGKTFLKYCSSREEKE